MGGLYSPLPPHSKILDIFTTSDQNKVKTTGFVQNLTGFQMKLSDFLISTWKPSKKRFEERKGQNIPQINIKMVSIDAGRSIRSAFGVFPAILECRMVVTYRLVSQDDADQFFLISSNFYFFYLGDGFSNQGMSLWAEWQRGIAKDVIDDSIPSGFCQQTSRSH